MDLHIKSTIEGGELTISEGIYQILVYTYYFRKWRDVKL